MKVKNYTTVDTKNLKGLYNRLDGNIYYRVPFIKMRAYAVCDGFTYEELYSALCAEECELIWIEGPSLGIHVEVEDN